MVSIEQVRAYLDNNEKDRKAKVITKLQFQQEATTSSELNFIACLFNGCRIRLQNQNVLPKDSIRSSILNSLAGTNQILMEADMNDAQHTDRTLESQVFIMNNDGTECRKLLGKDNYTYNNSFISPSGKTDCALSIA